MTAAVEEEGGDCLDVSVIEELAARERPLHHVRNTHHHSSEAGPFDALPCCEDLATVLADPSQTGRPGVTLSDRVRSDEAEGSPLPQQIERPTEKCATKSPLPCVPSCCWTSQCK